MTWGHQNAEEEAHAQMDYAVDHGINFFDTAEIYAIPPQKETQWSTEEYIGNWFAKTLKRKDIVLASKVVGPGFEYMRGSSGFTDTWIKEAIYWSLKRLQTDYIDLYQLHWPQRTVPLWWKLNYSDEMWKENNHHEELMLQTLQTLKELQKEWLIRHFWISNETARWTMKYALPRVQSIQNAYSILRREFETGLSEICLQEEIAFLPYSPLAWGITTGKYQNGAKPAWARYSTWWEKRMPYYTKQKCFDAMDKYIELAQSLGLTPTQLSLARVNDRAFVTSNIIGATSMEQLKENIWSADISLSQETYKKIDEIFTEFPNPATW